ncbi:energy transducer TonB family protein [Sphingomonas colocasiae]|uniref:TonB family protein n=1 Tax=Sphingomonas colocasiae TaxID=1848973 RepID=A0ABS7PP75_9SPHN|nr:energy transducer TonB [Sphingomonas colocasiae]MBY8822799.1 TonB family protein [Sphingomonas colocasiae]
MTFETENEAGAHAQAGTEDAATVPTSPSAGRSSPFPSHTDDWQPSPRFSDRSASLQGRLFGIGGTMVTGLIIMGGALFTWVSHRAMPPPVSLSVFDVAPPAAPAEPVREVPPGPEQVPKQRQQPDIETPRIEPPEIQLPGTRTVAAPPPRPVPDPGPPAETMTAPETRPAPPAPQVSTGKPTWEGLVLGALNKVKRYPREAAFRRQQGVPYIRFVMNREGRILSVRLERPSGIRSLDEEALSLPKRAQPLPKPPEDVKGDAIELVVPVEFFIK